MMYASPPIKLPEPGRISEVVTPPPFVISIARSSGLIPSIDFTKGVTGVFDISFVSEVMSMAGQESVPM